MCILCFCIALFIVSPFVRSCPFPIFVQVYRPLPPGGNPIAVNKYHIIYHFISYRIITKTCFEIVYLKFLYFNPKLDKEKNQSIMEKTVAQNIVKEIKQYQEKWLQHVQRMDTNRIPNKH